jgi:hypothetical protein
MAKAIRGSKIVFINEVDHEIYVHKAEDCIREIKTFIENFNQKQSKLMT